MSLTSIAYSFAKDQRSNNLGHQKIAWQAEPGSYNVENTINNVRIKSPEWKFPQTAREHSPETDSPGPGAYNANKIKSSLAYTMAGIGNMSMREQPPRVENKKLLGQLRKAMKETQTKLNQYSKKGTNGLIGSTKSPFGGNQYSKPSRLNQMNKSYNVGPGQYEVRKDIGSEGPKYSMQKRNYRELNQSTPGPGAYNARDEAVKARAKSPNLMGAGRNDQRIDNIPGPGNYYQDQYFGKDAKAVSIKSRPVEQTLYPIPGPGSYNPMHDAVKQSIRGVNIGTGSLREGSLSSRNDIPGPGTYSKTIQPLGSDVPMYSFRGKIKEKEQNNLPGPGQYEYQDRSSVSPSFKIGNASRNAEVNYNSVGPGAYDNASKIGTTGPKYSMGNKTVQILRDDSPGPGAYEPLLDQVRAGSPSIQMKGRLQDYSADIIPGPGTYNQNIKAIGSDSPMISIQGKGRSQMISEVPGPGQYDQNYQKNQAISYRMGTSSKNQSPEKLNRSWVPGPGTYDQTSLIGKSGPSISMKGKIMIQSQDRSPGPGNYNPNESFIKTKQGVAKFSQSKLEMRNSFQVGSLTPGPGTYDLADLVGRGSPAVVIQGRLNNSLIPEIPGPGSYNPQQSIAKSTTPTYKMPLSKREFISMKESFLPGPGQYEPKFMKTQIGFSIKGKTEQRSPDEIPGPGTYEAVSPNAIKSGQPTYNFGKSPKRDNFVGMKGIDVGPGQYNVDIINDQALLAGQISLSFTIPKGKSPDRFNDTPGPGAYESYSVFGLHAPQG